MRTQRTRGKNMNAQPKTKAAKNVKAGDWVVFGGMAFLVGQPATETNGDIYLPMGYMGSHFRPAERVKMHYSK
ncbi:hypothetical protein [Streptomyces sp. NPDC058092]|uniref:hypothetical protein n=1 Tax=Streptomyces sp. NPDC058092 TaxID=3346336 RepID=UPI0036ED2A57